MSVPLRIRRGVAKPPLDLRRQFDSRCLKGTAAPLRPVDWTAVLANRVRPRRLKGTAAPSLHSVVGTAVSQLACCRGGPMHAPAIRTGLPLLRRAGTRPQPVPSWEFRRQRPNTNTMTQPFHRCLLLRAQLL